MTIGGRFELSRRRDRLGKTAGPFFDRQPIPSKSGPIRPAHSSVATPTQPMTCRRGNKTDGQTVGINKSTVASYRKMAANSEKLDEYANSVQNYPGIPGMNLRNELLESRSDRVS